MFASSAASIGSYRQIYVSASADEGHACPVIANARHQVQHRNTVRGERIQGGWVRQGSSHIVGLVLHTLANTGRPLQALTSPQKLCLQQEIWRAVQGNCRPVYKWPINRHAGCIAIRSMQQQTYRPMCCQDGTSHPQGCTRRWRMGGGGGAAVPYIRVWRTAYILNAIVLIRAAQCIAVQRTKASCSNDFVQTQLLLLAKQCHAAY